MKFGSSGIRGIANQAVTSELALRIGRGVGMGRGAEDDRTVDRSDRGRRYQTYIVGSDAPGQNG
jgi:phosphomannomutase